MTTRGTALLLCAAMGAGQFFAAGPAAAWWYTPPGQQVKLPPPPPAPPAPGSDQAAFAEWREKMAQYMDRLDKWIKNHGGGSPAPVNPPRPDPSPVDPPRPGPGRPGPTPPEPPSPPPAPEPPAPPPAPTPPDPAPTPGKGACSAPANDLFKNPFNKNSAHHRPMGTGAVFAGDDHPSTRVLRQNGFGTINSDNGWGTNIYEPEAGDPRMTVRHAGVNPFNPGGGDHGLPVTLKVPTHAQNNEKVDSVVIITDGNYTAHQFYQWRSKAWRAGHHPPSDPQGPTARLAKQWDLRSEGHTGPGGARVGSSGSGVAGLFGLNRGHELNTPGYKIQHVMQVALSRDKKPACGMMMKNQVVWPASGKDGSCTNDENCGGAIPYGGLLAIPPSVKISSLGLSEPGHRVAEQLQQYGAYAIDTSSCPTSRADQHVSREVLQKLKADMQRIYPHLRLVLNNEKDQKASGGGQPLGPNCAFDSPDR